MPRTHHVAATPLVLSLTLLTVASALGQIGVGGITDKTIYTDQVTFTVTNTPGYAFDARLDSVQVPTGLPVRVTDVDYHELSVRATNVTTLATSSSIVRFIVRSGERGGTEDGIPPWTPYPDIDSATPEFAGAHLRLLAPSAFPEGMPIPVVAWVEDTSDHAVRVNGSVAAPGQVAFRLVRGVGSGFLAPTNPAGALAYSPTVGGLSTTKSIRIEAGTVWTAVGGTLAGNTTWPENSRIDVTNHLTLPTGSSLTIGAGSVVRVYPGIDITNEAQVVINGTLDNPVVFAPLSPSRPWGGFTMRTGSGSVLGTGVLFTGSGAKPDWFGTGGNPSSHRKEQSLFFCGGPNIVMLTDSAAISLAGQLGHAVNGGTFTFTRFLMQGTTTGGEYSGASQPLRFTVNDSAFIECPDHSAGFVDGDNDALYIVHGTHGFTNTLFGWTKDDGIDCGGSGAGTLNLQDCWFESTFHEGTSLSGTGKVVNHIHNVLLNCSQPVEVGYDGPTANVQRCLILDSLTGARFGDNYNWTYTGFLNVSNSILLHNHRNIWGMNWADWTYRSNQMAIVNNWLSASDPRWPSNALWDPSVDAFRLAGYANVPPDAPVGLGFAVRSDTLTATEFTNGLPIRLSRFHTNFVSVAYKVASNDGLLTGGTVVFEPGETLKRLYLPIFDPGSYPLMSVTLEEPVNAEITGLDRLFSITPPSTAATLISRGATWRHLDLNTNLPVAWVTSDFVDTNWPSGPGQLGFGDGDEVTLVASNRQVTTYFRHTFNVPDPSVFSNLTVALLRDDGGIVYLNGTEVFRSNLPGSGVTYQTLATNALPQDESTFYYTNAIKPGVLIPGENLCAVEIHQSSVTSSDLSFDLLLLGNLPPPPVVLKKAQVDTDLILYWDDPAWALEESPSLSGPWGSTPTSGSVQAVKPGSGSRFYRLKQ